MQTRWGWLGLKMDVVVAILMVPMMAAQLPEIHSIAGEWDGMIGKQHLVFEFEQTPENGLKLKLTSVDQGNAIVPVDSVTFAGGKLDVEMKSIGGSYVATLSATGDSLVGTWAQGAANLPLTLHRPGAKAAAFTLKPRTIGTVLLEPCRTVDGNTEGLCGTVSVWENRELKRGRRLALKVMVLPALSGGAADAFFPLAGGPGQSAIELYPMTGYTNAIRKERDVVLVDQRGTGGSAPLNCALRDMNSAQDVLGEEIPAERLRACRKQLEQTADLTQYTTSIFADDLDEVRAALGYEKIDVFGTSYGTRAALVYLRQHGKHVRTIGLEGVVSPEYRFPGTFSHALQSSIDQIIERCEADTACEQSYPDLRKEFDTLLVRLDKEPAKAEVTVGGSKQTVTISKGLFVSTLRPALYMPQVISAFPLMIHKAYEGHWNVYASVALQIRTALDKAINRDMSLSVVCAEDVPGTTEAMIREESAGTYLGDYQVRQYQHYCSEWAQGHAPADFHAAIHSDVPALLISGALDPATPPEVSREMSRNLSNSQTVLLNNGTHGTGSPCVDGIVERFVATAARVNDSCVADMKLGPFLTETK
ncbi:alpha/beta hydrolase [Granulicella sp. S156]|jgi:pimeloyl-ACP methyl ester carboxylesterase|uniref:alpha/beta hydrolase n=1 Tax=Granulicella sp. S156 TaxID=1747224 RepID=UPI00131BF626|nr:alpha/beta hydrolase [Granulicella sp. S156]